MEMKPEMNSQPAALSKPYLAKNLHHIVQKMIDENLSQNEHLAQELYENTAQSLVAINTQLILLEKKTAQTAPLFLEDVRELNFLIQTILSQIRNSEYDLTITSLSNLGLEAVLREFCLRTSIMQDFPIYFECNRHSQDMLDRSQSLCLYYFVNLILEFASKEKWSSLVSLEIQENKTLVDCQIFSEPTQSKSLKSSSEQLLPILQGWMNLWDGELQFQYTANDSLQATASFSRERA